MLPVPMATLPVIFRLGEHSLGSDPVTGRPKRRPLIHCHAVVARPGGLMPMYLLELEDRP